MPLIVIIVILVLLFGGGGYYYGRWCRVGTVALWRRPGRRLVVIILLVLWGDRKPLTFPTRNPQDDSGDPPPADSPVPPRRKSPEESDDADDTPDVPEPNRSQFVKIRRPLAVPTGPSISDNSSQPPSRSVRASEAKPARANGVKLA